MSQIGMRLTSAGSNLLAKGLLGKEIHFTRGALGSGNFDYETEQVWELAEIRQWEMDIPIESIEKIGDGTVRIVCHKTNAEVYDGFPAREHAVFATDPDTGAEILYSYCNTGEEYSYIPSNNSPVTKDIKFSYVTIIRDAENVTATLDLSFAYTSTTDFEDHINAAHPHPNTPNHFDNVTSTSRLWATDEDDHLHQISVNNLRELLRDDTAETSAALSDEEKTFKAQNELGLTSNLLVIEDFTGESVTDNYKIKVTSSAENGRLLGLENVDDLQTGAYYTISDGYNQEVVKIASVRYNTSGYHAQLENRLDNSYDWNATYLYRTTTAGADKKVLSWQTAGFGGVEANIARVIELETKIENAQDFEISGDGILDTDGSFTLTR